MHGKETQRFLDEMGNAKEGGLKEALRYVEKEKALDWLGMAPPKGATQTNQGLNSAAKVIEGFENPKLSGEKKSDGETASGVRFQVADEGERYNPVAAKDETSREPERRVNSKMVRFVERTFDNYYPLKVALDMLRDTGMKIEDNEDFHLQATALKAKFDKHKEEFDVKYIAPMTKAIAKVMKKTGLSMREMENYAMTLHGVKDRNRTMREDALKELDRERDDAVKEIDREQEKSIKVVERDRERALGKIDKEMADALHDPGKKKSLEEKARRIEEEASEKKYRIHEEAAEKKRRREAAHAEKVEKLRDELREKDYSGVYAIAAEIWAERKGLELRDNIDMKAILEDEAFKSAREALLEEIVSDTEARIRAAGMDAEADFWNPVRKATGYALRRLYDAGYLLREEYDELLRRWKYFVPLRGHDMPTAEDVYRYTRNMGTYFTDGLKHAKGRVSRAESPFAYIAQMGYSAISQSNRNLLFQTIRRLAAKDRTGTFTVSRAWYDAKTGEMLEPEYSEAPETYRRNQEAFEAEMREKEEQKLVTRRRKRLDLGGMFIEKRDERQHAVPVYLNGEPHRVYVNGNPAIAQSIMGMNRPVYDAMNKLMNGLKNSSHAVTRFQAMCATALSPIFAWSNAIRDQRFAITGTVIEEGFAYALRAGANLPSAAQALARRQSGYADRHGRKKKMDRYVYEYMMNGGKTGYSALLSLDRIKRQIDKDIMREVNDTKVKKAVRAINPKHLVDGMLAVNEYIENLTRFQVYMTSRQMGRSVERSISDAKNVTLNFDQGGTQTSQLTPVYMFIRANLQGIYKSVNMYLDHPVKMTGVFAWRAAMGATLLPALAHLIGGDDGEEEYWKLSDNDRQTKTCIFLGWRDRGDGNGGRFGYWLKIPVSQSIYDAYMNREAYPVAFFRLTEEQRKSVEKLNAKFAREESLKRGYEMLESEEYKGTVMRTKMGLPYSNDRRERDGLSHAIEDLKLRLRDPDLKAKEKRVAEQEPATAYARFPAWYLRGMKNGLILHFSFFMLHYFITFESNYMKREGTGLGGITTTTSYKDGQMYSLLNLRGKNGSLQPVAPASEVGVLPVEEGEAESIRELFEHRCDTYAHLIMVRRDAEGIPSIIGRLRLEDKGGVFAEEARIYEAIAAEKKRLAYPLLLYFEKRLHDISSGLLPKSFMGKAVTCTLTL